MFSLALFYNIRFYILVFSVILSFIIFFLTRNRIIEFTLVQAYALTAVAYLYLALLATPVIRNFKTFPFKAKYAKARRAIGVSAFYFASLHAWLAFFDEIGGLDGYFSLNLLYKVATLLSLAALIILFLMAVTSFDWAVAKLTFPRWKLLHRFVYFAGISIIIHALLIGGHFGKLNTLVPQLYFLALSFLFVLEAWGIEKMLKQKHPSFPRYFLVSAISTVLLYFAIRYFFPVFGT